MLSYSRLKRLAREKHSGLFDPFIRYVGKKFCECCKHFIFFVTTEYSNKLECYITLGRKGLPGVKHSGLFGPFISYEELLQTGKVYQAQALAYWIHS